MRSEPAAADAETRPAHPLLSLLVGVCGLVAALALPFAPVIAERVSLTWPTPGEPVASTTAVLAPYRPSALTAAIPCTALRPTGTSASTVLATAPDGAGLAVTAGAAGAAVHYEDHAHALAARYDDPGCRVVIHARSDGLSVADGDGATTTIAGPVPKVFGFHTDLTPAQAEGMTVSADVTSPFGTSPTFGKRAMIVAQLVAAAAALFLLRGARHRRRRPWKPSLWWIDAGMLAVLACWAIIGPLAVDDGWATMIARNFAATGEAGNYYRWWNAAEVPFALSQQVLSKFTEVSLAPLWLRLPSTVLAFATWLVLSRGVLGAAIPAIASTARVRLLAALLLLAAWLPFNLGVRPESYVALGATAVLALAWRARTPRGLGWAVLAAALTVPISPTGLLAVAPLAVFAPRIIRNAPRSRLSLAVNIALLSCIAAVALTAVFADQTWSALLTATDWHAYFGPSLPWYHEPDRYSYLLGDDQQGSAAKRLPILLTAAMLVTVALLALHRRPRTAVERSALRLAAVVVLAVLAFAAVPSKWSYHLGGAAGLIASFLAVAVVLTSSRVRTSARHTVAAVAGAVVISLAAALAFAGPNAWWLSTVYDVPLQAGPIRPEGLPLDNPLLWLGGTTLGCVVYGLATRAEAARSAPALAAITAAAASVIVVLGSFAVAPMRRPAGSLALANLHRLSGSRVCGLADDIQVLPDGPELSRAEGPWFALPRLAANDVVTASLSGGADGRDAVAFEFGRSDGAQVVELGVRAPAGRPIGIDAAAVPPGSNRVRIKADDPGLQATGFRLRSAVGLNEFLAANGPVLMSWPTSFVFPCVHNIAGVARGVAQAPGVVIEPPRPYFSEDRDPSIGGTFAAAAQFGDFHEVPSRLVGHPDLDWGTVLVAEAGQRRDAYQLSVTPEIRWGFDATGRARPER